MCPQLKQFNLNKLGDAGVFKCSGCPTLSKTDSSGYFGITKEKRAVVSDSDLVDIQSINPRIRVDIRYATANNFIGKPVYPCAKCYLRRKVAMKLDRIQQRLEKISLGLKIFDGYRPLSIQKVFWDYCPDPRFVVPPEKGSRQNRGAAVDLTLVDQEGDELKMPTAFDDFTDKAHRPYERLPKEVIHNRTLLESVMCEQGFIPLDSEWWHFDDAEGENYPIEDISLDQLA